MESTSIAGVILTFDEEKNIERCLNSLAWCDELLVLDSGSRDRTKEIALMMGARVEVHQQDGVFEISKQRNWAITECGLKSKWVIFMDADEEVGAECREAVVRTIEGAGSSHIDGFEMTPRFWFLGKWLKHTQGYPNWHPRIVKRGRAWFVGGVWESFNRGASIERIDSPYEHYAFSKGIADWLQRHIRYADWEALKIIRFREQRDASVLGTDRAINLRILSATFWTLRPVTRFMQKFVFQGGFLEGWQGLLFALLMSVYEVITVVKVIEKTRLMREEAL